MGDELTLNGSRLSAPLLMTRGLTLQSLQRVARRRSVPSGVTAFVILFAVMLSQIALREARAQNGEVEARVASVRGSAVLLGRNRARLALARGDELRPGDAIDTRGGGRVVIELSDGSEFIVQAGSRVVLKDYRTASTLRELLEITIGRIRVKINHWGGRPNPYRVNSPSASIAVRGTEFGVGVALDGETDVEVYSGLVEVTSILRLGDRVLVLPGNGVVVRPNGEIRPFVAGSKSRVAGSNNSEDADQNKIPGQDSGDTQNIGNSQRGNHEDSRAQQGIGDADANRASLGSSARYIDGVLELAQAPVVSRFIAFSDSHFDSLRNPSYATEFRSAQGRIFLLPSLGGALGLQPGGLNLGIDPRAADHGLSLDGSLFVPVPTLRAVVGGSFVASQGGLRSSAFDQGVSLLGSVFEPGAIGARRWMAATSGRAFGGSLMAARRFGGEGRTSVGIGLDLSNETGSLSSVVKQSDLSGLQSDESITSRSILDRKSVTLGLSHVFPGSHKLGLSYRYGTISAYDYDVFHTLDSEPLGINSTRASGRSSEFGLLLRGPLSHRMFYGVEATALSSDIEETLQRQDVLHSSVRANTRRLVAGLGLGYVLSPRAILSLDMSGGLSGASAMRREDAAGAVIEDRRQHRRFASAHAAFQSDLWRSLFANASIAFLTQRSKPGLAIFPDSFGNLPVTDGSVAFSGLSGSGVNRFFSNFGIGWRFKPNFSLQYVLSTDYGFNPLTHQVVLRYDFNFRKD
jgi:hypothetical protein